MPKYNIVAEMNEQTVVTEYKPIPQKSEAYQSEAELEKEFIRMLQEQGYEYIKIDSETELSNNLKKQLELLNDYTFTDHEWDIFFKDNIVGNKNSNDSIQEKTRTIQEDYIKNLRREDKTIKNIYLLDKKNVHNNRLQVINQYKAENGTYKNRYDVTILVNGLPLVHIELKRRGEAIRQAFNQINRYLRDSFWSDNGLFEYIQLFVISNGTNTKYYSNTTRFNHIKNNTKAKKENTSNSFEFTSFWADSKNKIIPDLVDFTRTFFAKHTLLNVLCKYCVYTADKMLLVMRPYQIVATEKILDKIEISTNYKQYGTINGGGFIWHTTGSGKTLTSFKTARIASRLPYIDKVLFVVDRKDLDYQTMREYDKFEKGAANSNRSTEVLKKQLEDDNARIIITTIQKLSTFIKKYSDHDVYKKHIVLIFDECHRSQFGEMHSAIVKKFKMYHIFGFTGTPIFSINATKNNGGNMQTTEQTFGVRLHSYTIVDAIIDKNVLPFRVEYNKTFGMDDDIDDKEVWDINREKVYSDPRRIEMVAKYVLDHFNQKTYRNEKNYTLSVVKNVNEVVTAKDRNNVNEIKEKAVISGFNSIFAVASIDMAKAYYSKFKELMELEPNKKLKIALIYSYGANEEEIDGIIDEENSDDTANLDQSSRDFLEDAIQDYNIMFGTSFDTSADKFSNYYKDVSLRMKNKEIDMLIVVNMFLTGFDATTLNTLWVDKNLKMHGLIQAYSRTNRILNSIKTFGNIVCFRNLQKRTDSAIALFGDKDASGLIILRPFKDYYNGYDDKDGKHKKGYKELIDELKENYPLTDERIIGEQKQKEFVKLFGDILRMKNLLVSFDEFENKEILTEIEFQNYSSRYLDIRDEMINKNGKELEDINDDIVFEIELLKQVDINIDYILMLVQKYHDSHCKDKELYISIQSAIDGSPELRSKKKLIETFVAGINDIDDVIKEWRIFVAEEKEKELKTIIEEEHLKEKETRDFIADSFKNGYVKEIGTDIDKILPPMSLFGGGKRAEKKKNVLRRIIEFFERFFGI